MTSSLAEKINTISVKHEDNIKNGAIWTWGWLMVLHFKKTYGEIE